MQSIRNVLTALAIAGLLLGGCAATPEASLQDDASAKRFDSVPGAAIVYLYRNDGPDNRGFTTLWLDGRLVGEILPSSYYRVSVRPGRNLLTAFGGDAGRLEFETRGDEVYFVAVSVRGEYGDSRSEFRRVAPAVGRAQIERCCRLLETWKPGQNRIQF
jgi:hypothetical protein